MRKAEVGSGNFVGIVLALIVFGVGFVLTLVVPILGWVVGPLLMLLSLGMGGKRSNVWRCKSCRVALPRGERWDDSNSAAS